MAYRRIALTGGIASGKSTVAGMFSRLGAIVLDADKAARDAVEPGSPCWSALRELLGPLYFHPDGELKRRELRNRIIDNQDCRSRVNAILHPAIMSAMEDEFRRIKRVDPGRVVLFDIPLLFEAGFADRFDTIILVYTPPEIQIQRLMRRDGLTREEAEATLTMQLPIDSKKVRCRIIIDNSLGMDETALQVNAAWEKITREEAGAGGGTPSSKQNPDPQSRGPER
jgi:dephospho-CoA kinase